MKKLCCMIALAAISLGSVYAAPQMQSDTGKMMKKQMKMKKDSMKMMKKQMKMKKDTIKKM